MSCLKDPDNRVSIKMFSSVTGFGFKFHQYFSGLDIIGPFQNSLEFDVHCSAGGVEDGLILGLLINPGCY